MLSIYPSGSESTASGPQPHPEPMPGSARSGPAAAQTTAAQTTGAQTAIRLRLGPDQHLWLERSGHAERVRAVRCFPWSARGELVSLRDGADREAYLVQNLGELDPESGAALQSVLGHVGFVLEVRSVESIEEDYEVRVWHTHTLHGKRTFQTRLDEWPWPSPDGGHLVRDLAGDLFRLPPLDSVDAKTRRWLWAYVG